MFYFCHIKLFFVNHNIQFEKTLMPHIGRTAKYAGYYFIDTLLEHGIDLSKEQWLVLKKLHEKDGQVQNNLAFLTNRSKTSLTRLINTMEKKGYVNRKNCEEDKRINHVYLSQKGRKIYDRSLPLLRIIISSLEEGIKPKDLEITIKVLTKVQKNISKHHKNI